MSAEAFSWMRIKFILLKTKTFQLEHCWMIWNVGGMPKKSSIFWCLLFIRVGYLHAEIHLCGVGHIERSSSITSSHFLCFFILCLSCRSLSLSRFRALALALCCAQLCRKRKKRMNGTVRVHCLHYNLFTALKVIRQKEKLFKEPLLFLQNANR